MVRPRIRPKYSMSKPSLFDFMFHFICGILVVFVFQVHTLRQTDLDVILKADDLHFTQRILLSEFVFP